MTEPLDRLADFIREQRDDIVAEWERIAEADEQSQLVSKLTRDEFRNNIDSALEGFCRGVATADGRAAALAARGEIQKHGHHRWKQGFNLNELIRDWGHLDQALSGAIAEFFTGHVHASSADQAKAYGRLAEFMTIAMSESVSRYDHLRQAEAASVAEDLAIANEEFKSVVELSQGRSRRLREAVHDLRGNLSVIALSAETLRAHDTQPTDVIDRLARSVVTVGEMLSGLHDLSRLESGSEPVQLQPTDVADLLTQLGREFEPHAARKGLELVVDGDEQLSVETDAGKVRRIAQNLLINAIKYTEEGEIRLTWQHSGARWTLEVADSGPGMQETTGSPIAGKMDDSEEPWSLVGDPGGAAYAGEGIGLTIVKRLCEALDASFDLESEAGTGTRIRVDFPAAPETAP